MGWKAFNYLRRSARQSNVWSQKLTPRLVLQSKNRIRRLPNMRLPTELWIRSLRGPRLLSLRFKRRTEKHG
jgi:hypothetical protein